MELIFVNDAIAEKKDDQNGGGSARLFQKALLEYANQQGLKIETQTAAPDNLDTRFTLLDGRLGVTFTSCEMEAAKGSPCETPADKRQRLENRDAHGKLRERKGGAVLAGMEMDPPAPYFKDKPLRVVRCLVDGDSAHPMASFVGDAAYSILEKGRAAYLGNLRHPCTCVSTAAVAEESGGGARPGARAESQALFFGLCRALFVSRTIPKSTTIREPRSSPSRPFAAISTFKRPNSQRCSPMSTWACWPCSVAI